MDNFEKFSEPRLPARILWKNSLIGGEVSVNPSEYNHAIKVFSKLAHYYTASNLSGDVFLKKEPKPFQSLQRKEGYVLHYLTLQLYVQ